MPYGYSKTSETDPILVVIEPHSDVLSLLRSAKQRATRFDLKWEALFVESSLVMHGLNLEDREHMYQMKALAERLGARVTSIETRNSLQSILTLLEERRREGKPIGTVVTSARRRRGLSKLQPTLADQLKLRLGKRHTTSVLVVGSELTAPTRIMEFVRISPKELLYAVLAIVAATLLVEVLDYFWTDAITAQHRNKSVIYMTACALVAARYGLLAGMVAGVSSFFAMGALYVAPIGGLYIDTPEDMASLALFLLGAITIALVANVQHGFSAELAKRGGRLQSLLRLHRIMLTHHSRAEAIKLLDHELFKLLNTEVAFFMPSTSQQDKLEADYKGDISLSDCDTKALYAAWEEGRTTGVGSSFDPGCSWRFEPLTSSHGELGILGVRISSIQLTDTMRSLINGIADQAAMILERLELGQAAENTRIQVEREKLRAMLLSSVSHDLKTPLASVIGSLSVYRSMGDRLPAEQRQTLIVTALDEAQRLDSFITNILDMTRIESGQVQMKHEWVEPQLLISDVLKRLRDRIRNHKVTVHPLAQPLEVRMDRMMTGQILQNLLDNAAKYTPAGTHIEINWRLNGTHCVCEVRDHGPGIPDSQLEKVFDKYTRVHRQDSQVAGTGLGLAIARAVMNAQNGYINASNHPEGGAIFTVALPVWRENAKDGGQRAA